MVVNFKELPYYRIHVVRDKLTECNRVLKLFKNRHDPASVKVKLNCEVDKAILQAEYRKRKAK
jgi:hypothetical protein